MHGAAAAQGAIDASGALFGRGELASLDEASLAGAVRELPRAVGAVGAPITQLLVDAELVSSLGEARRALAQGGVYLNNVQIDDQDRALAADDLLHGRFAVLRRGKKTLAGVIVEA